MPIVTAPTARSENTASICAATKSGGTSWIAGMIGRYLIEQLADLPVDVEQQAVRAGDDLGLDGGVGRDGGHWTGKGSAIRRA